MKTSVSPPKRKGREKRLQMRFNKAFPVLVGSEIYGDSRAVARNISLGGMLVEMTEPLPLGTCVTVHFRIPDSSAAIVAHAEVKHQYCFNFCRADELHRARGIGLRFVEFIADSADRLQESFSRGRVLH